MKRTLGFVAIPLTFAAGSIAAHALLRGAPASIAIDRAQPLLVVTAWATYGAHALYELLATFACALPALAATIAAFERGTGASRSRDRTIVIAIAAASALACLTWPFVFSSDVYAYAAYGDLALRRVSPFVVAPANAHDGLLDGARWQWSGTFPPCVYGTGFVAIAAAFVELARAISLDAAGTLALFRIGAILAFLATIACAFRAGASTRTVAIAALNPVVIWSVAEGHNDVYALLAAAAVAAFLHGESERKLAFGLLSALCIKVSAVLALAPFIPVFARQRPFVRIAIAATLAGAAAVALDLPLLLGLRVRAAGSAFPTVSLGQAIGTVPALCAAALLAAVAFAALRRGNRSGYAWLGLAAFAALPNPYPWYGVVLVVLAAAAGRNPASIGLYAVTICAALRYLPDAFGDMSPGTVRAVSFVLAAPIVFALTGLPRDLRPAARALRLEKERQTP